MTVDARCCYNTIGLLRSVNTLLVVSQFLTVVTTQTLDCFDFLCVRDVIRLEVFMADSTFEITVRGLLELQTIYVK